MPLPSRRPKRNLVASAYRIGDKDSDWSRRQKLPWQQQALEVTKIVPELGFASRFYARMMKPLRIYPAKGYSVTIPVRVGDRAPVVSLTDDEHKLVYSNLSGRLRVRALRRDGLGRGRSLLDGLPCGCGWGSHHRRPRHDGRRAGDRHRAGLGTRAAGGTEQRELELQPQAPDAVAIRIDRREPARGGR